jgi:hypothetical protein
MIEYSVVFWKHFEPIKQRAQHQKSSCITENIHPEFIHIWFYGYLETIIISVAIVEIITLK